MECRLRGHLSTAEARRLHETLLGALRSDRHLAQEPVGIIIVLSSSRRRHAAGWLIACQRSQQQSPLLLRRYAPPTPQQAPFSTSEELATEKGHADVPPAAYLPTYLPTWSPAASGRAALPSQRMCHSLGYLPRVCHNSAVEPPGATPGRDPCHGGRVTIDQYTIVGPQHNLPLVSLLFIFHAPR